MKLLGRYAVLLLAGYAFPLPAFSAEESGRPAPASTKTHRIVNRIAATVNGRPITSVEVRARLIPYFKELNMLYPQQGPRFAAELVKAKKAVVDELIERELVLSEFEIKGYSMPDTAVDNEINRRILTQFNGDRDALLDNLRASGMNYGEFRDSVRKEVTVSAMRSSRYDRDIPPTPDEIRAEYERSRSEYRDISQDAIRYQKIFLPAIPTDDPEVAKQHYEQALELRNRIAKGDISFEDAARAYSQDMYAQDGGQWPYIKRNELSVEFANIVFSMPEGQVSEPMLDPMGLTIVRVQGKRLAPAPPLSDPAVRERVDDAVRRKQSEERYRQWVERLRNRAVIRTFI